MKMREIIYFFSFGCKNMVLTLFSYLFHYFTFFKNTLIEWHHRTSFPILPIYDIETFNMFASINFTNLQSLCSGQKLFLPQFLLDIWKILNGTAVIFTVVQHIHDCHLKKENQNLSLSHFLFLIHVATTLPPLLPICFTNVFMLIRVSGIS